MTYCDLLDFSYELLFQCFHRPDLWSQRSHAMCPEDGGLTTWRLPGAFRFPFFCAGCSPDFGFLRADALDHHRAASPEPLVGRCEASLGFGCAGCWFLLFQSCHNWQCHTLEFLGGLGPPKNLFFPKQVCLWGSILEKKRLDTLVGARAVLGADLAVLGAGCGRAGRAGLGWAWGLGALGALGWVGCGIWPCWGLALVGALGWIGRGFGCLCMVYIVHVFFMSS